MENRLEILIDDYKEIKIKEKLPNAELGKLGLEKRLIWEEIKKEMGEHSPARYMKIFRTIHPEKALESQLKQKEKNHQLKIEVLTHYGNGNLKCTQCDEKREICLTIDHIKGGGTYHRKVLNLHTGNQFYNWLKKNNYPSGFQTLCMNCQFIKRYNNHEIGGYSKRNAPTLNWQDEDMNIKF